MTRFESLQNELLTVEGVTAVSATSNIPGQQFNQHHIASVRYPDDDISTSEVFIDYDFFETLDIPLVAGRAFSRGNPADMGNAYILNETAARQLNLEGEAEILWKQREQNTVERGTVVGVVKDFHFQSLHEPIRPLLFKLTKERFNYILIKIDPENFAEKITDVEKVYKEFEPVFGFEFSFLEDQLNHQYAAEQRTGAILGIFTLIAILIASFGLFGMSLLTFQQKIKELSVRKVLGASLPDLLFLLVGDFTKLIVLAVVLAIPLAWWLMHQWLQNFSYQVGIHPLVFAMSGLALVFIAWATLSYFTIKASELNPAETLKSE